MSQRHEQTDPDVIVHGVWTRRSFVLWGEHARGDAPRPVQTGHVAPGAPRPAHPRALSADELRQVLLVLCPSAARWEDAEVAVRLPGAGDDESSVAMVDVRCPAVTGTFDQVQHALAALRERGWTCPSPFGGAARGGASLRFYAAALRLARFLAGQQRFVPMLVQEARGEVTGTWMPWVSDEPIAVRVADLVRSMPGSARCAIDENEHSPWAVLSGFLTWAMDARCRQAMRAERLDETIQDRDPMADPHVAWLGTLLGEDQKLPGTSTSRTEAVRGVRRWIAGLEDRGASAAWRLALVLTEPAQALADFQVPGEEVQWTLSFRLEAADDPSVWIDGADVWLLPGDSLTLEGRRLDSPQELLLAELARASHIYKRLERCLEEREPSSMGLSTRDAYVFLRENGPILSEQGFSVRAPDWWDSPSARLGARLRLDSDPVESILGSPGPGGAARPSVGLSSLVNYHWEMSIGGVNLTMQEFERLANLRTPLVRIGGRWVEIRPDDVRAAMEFISANPGGSMAVMEALRVAFGAEQHRSGVQVVGLEASGWVAALLGGEGKAEQLPIVAQPAGFAGALRPYQLRGVSWMAFLERFGLGPCLADDMGLGKTIQLLALLVHERETAPAGEVIAPTLLVVPMSVLGNWVHEAKRFCPSLRVVVHHGAERATGDAFLAMASSADAVITTFALAHRDRAFLERVAWRRIVLDEAQYIKNPAAKQSQAVRSLLADRRVALTGTPVENRLSELWSIIDFLNPGYLGASSGFRKRFAAPIERHHDQDRRRQLRGLVQPIILRRLKSDPSVLADLPEKVETREYCHLSTEQATLYESHVQRMLSEIDRAAGIHRRGLVLAALIRLKQICNHPAQLLHEHHEGAAVDAARSGKAVRLLDMLDEVLGNSERALVFTQFRQMGHLLQAMIQRRFDRPVLFLHGGVPQRERDEIVREFQRPEGQSPVLVASLKAGGVGLNLTAATHVFHYDRWWNPAVENQATDRAYRIGQTRAVQVHKFVVTGTLEERIDEMIERKTELAERIIGSGERWLTELDTDQLRDLLTLRRDAVGDDE